jgi:hypothetical protein
LSRKQINLLKGLRDVTQTFWGQLTLTLLIFVFLRITSAAVFYNGFLGNFEKLHKFSEVVPIQVPFHSWSIVFGALLHPIYLLMLGVLYFGWFYKTTSVQQQSPSEKIIISLVSLVLSWELCTYDYNYFLDNGFSFDRIVLLLLPFLIWYLPALLPFFIASAFVYRSQFNYPVDGFELYDKRILFDILLMFLAFSYLARRVKHTEISFLFLVLCIVASNYFMCGIKKLVISPHGFEWLIYNDLVNLFHNAHHRGWLADASSDVIEGLAEVLAKFNFVFKLLILLVELLALFLLRSRKGALMLLSSFFLLHVGIFIFGSMLFWKWIVVDLLMLFIFLYSEKESVAVFSRRNFKASVIIILLSLFWLRPYMIGWWDTEANEFFTYEVVTDDDATYEISKNGMNPYHQWFQYDDFWFLINEKHLAISSLGYTNSHKLAVLIKNAGPAGLLKLEQERGRNDFDALKKKEFEDFIRQFFSVKNKTPERSFFTYLRAPYHLHSGTFGTEYAGAKKVILFRIYLNKTYTVKGEKINISRKMIDEIMILA